MTDAEKIQYLERDVEGLSRRCARLESIVTGAVSALIERVNNIEVHGRTGLEPLDRRQLLQEDLKDAAGRDY